MISKTTNLATEATSRAPSWSITALEASFLLAATLLVYWPSYRAGFIWDDDAMIIDNPLIKADWDGLRDIWFSTKFHDYVPLTLTSFWLEWRLWGMEKAGYHMLNVLLHALNVLLLWRVLLRLRVTGAWLAALLFAVHPVCVASVTWVAERKNTLSMAFFLLSLLSFLRFDELTNQHTSTRNPRRATLRFPSSILHRPSSLYCVSLAAFLLALCSKPSVVMLPIVLLLCLWWLHGNPSRRDVVRAVPFFLLAGAFGLKTIAMTHHHGPGGSVQLVTDSLLVRSLGATWAVWFYISKDLWPLNLTMHYPRWNVDPTALLSYLPGAVLLGLLLLFWGCRRNWGRAYLFGFGYFLVALSPALGVLNMAYLTLSRVADHLQYLALPGLIALSVAGLCQAMHHAPLTRQPLSFIRHLAYILLLLLPLSALTWQRERIVGNPEALWRDNIAKNPNSWPARNNLGRILAERGDYQEAEMQCLAAVAVAPDSSAAHYNLGLAFFYQHKLDEAIREFSAAVRLAPTDSRSHNNLANALLKRGSTDEAIAHFREALRLDSANQEARLSFADVLNQQGKDQEAKALYLEALRLNPNDSTAHNNLGQILAVEGKLDQALPHFIEAVLLEPDSAEAQANLASVFASQGDLPQSVRHYLAAVRFLPETPLLRIRLGDVFTRQGRKKEAAEHYALAHGFLTADFSKQGKKAEAITEWREALKFKPDSAGMLNNLAWLLATSTDPKCRNGNEAVQLAENARAFAGSKSPSFLDTLAAAYAEAGRFDEAQKTAQNAIESAEQAGEREMAVKLRGRLKFYQARQPYREPNKQLTGCRTRSYPFPMCSNARSRQTSPRGCLWVISSVRVAESRGERRLTV